MNDPDNSPDPRALLEAFVASQRSERAFAKLVDRLQGLVFTSALRRTASPQLAEEVAQNIFAIMARKADSLQRHPSLLAWILETTRLQSATILRSERRRRRKIAALAEETKHRDVMSAYQSESTASWKDAVPVLDEALDRLSVKEREMVLQRFYEGRKFNEIAERGGQSEEACRMRVKRALEKLSSFMTSRGVTLSGAAVASLLGAEFARAVPAHTAAALAPNALATSSSLSKASLLANTLQTMSNLKTTAVTAAAVLAIMAIPFSLQLAEGNRIQAELRVASDRQPGFEPGTRTIKRERRSADRRNPEPRTARSLLAKLGQPNNNRALIRGLLGDDSLEESLAWGRIAEMSPEELKGLLADLQKFPCDGVTKDLLTAWINDYAPEESPRERLERMIAGGRRAVAQRHMNAWAISEPDAALAWYLEKRASGELDPGLNDEMHENVLSDLVTGLAQSSPEMALEFYRSVPREEMNSLVPQWMASALATELMESGDETNLRRLLEMHSGEDRSLVLTGTLGEFARNGKFDEGMALLDRYNPDPALRNDYIEDLFRNSLMPNQLQSGLDWVVASTPEADAPAVMERMIGAAARRFNDSAREWVGRQEPGPVRDVGYAALVDRMAEIGKYPEALAEAERINDPSLRAETRKSVGVAWFKKDPEQAGDGLPADLREELQNR